MAEWHDHALEIIIWGLVLNAGVGCAFAALPNLIVGAVEAHETGEATGVNTIARNVGASLGGQVAGSIVAGHVVAGGTPADSGFEVAFLMSAGVALVAAAAGLLIPVVRRGAAPASSSDPLPAEG
jgi:MFS family permease